MNLRTMPLPYRMMLAANALGGWLPMHGRYPWPYLFAKGWWKP